MEPYISQTRALLFRRPSDTSDPVALHGLGVELLALGIRTNVFEAEDPLARYARYAEEAARLPESDLVLIAEGEDANWLQEKIYDFLQPRPPTAIVLANLNPNAELLNRFPCPFLLVHSREMGRDPQLREAIHHHAYRYGDPTEHYPDDQTHLSRKIAEWITHAVKYRHDPEHWSEILKAI